METNIKAKIIVGLGYGDEGKGLTTEYLCSQSSLPIVIRYCGGPQAAHTVMLGDKKHVFSNFGSGSLRGAPTYFGEHTCFYPVTIARELRVLKALGINPKLILHPLAKMITPFDVFENRWDKKNGEHGTCGLGVGKTMKRNEGTFKLHAIDLLNKDVLSQKIITIKESYYTFSKGRVNILKSVNKSFTDEVLDFKEALEMVPWNIQSPEFLKKYNDLIFEGAQGILLDMDHGVFPHVTYANTTSKNAHLLLDELGIDDREMYYVTRSYSTRHGSGPFKYKALDLKNHKEETNVFNEYQKDFKIGDIDYDKLRYALRIDNIYSEKITKNLVVTCLDQIEEFDYSEFAFSFYFKSIFESRSSYSSALKEKTNIYELV